MLNGYPPEYALHKQIMEKLLFIIYRKLIIHQPDILLSTGEYTKHSLTKQILPRTKNFLTFLPSGNSHAKHLSPENFPKACYVQSNCHALKYRVETLFSYSSIYYSNIKTQNTLQKHTHIFGEHF